MPKVLVVDDTADSCEVLARLVSYLGYEAVSASSGTEALRIVETTPVDLVILDVMMPDIDGIEVLKRIRASRKTAAIPVAMFSALPDSDMRRAAIEHGADAYWVKGEADFAAIERLIPQWMGHVE